MLYSHLPSDGASLLRNFITLPNLSLIFLLKLLLLEIMDTSSVNKGRMGFPIVGGHRKEPAELTPLGKMFRLGMSYWEDTSG